MKRITEQDIKALFDLRPRRHKFCEPPRDTPLREPAQEGGDWLLQFPFEETFWPEFQAAVRIRTIGIRIGKKGGHYTFLKPAFSFQMDAVKEWISRVAPYVGIRDHLDACFALDYDRVNGDPARAQTEIGQLRARAKVYDLALRRPDEVAIRELTQHMVKAYRNLAILRKASCIVATPPSDPNKPFVVPRAIAGQMAAELKLPDLSNSVRTIKARPQAKNLSVAEKVDALVGTIACDAKALKGQRILLIDDLYQSGATLNYVAKLLADADAESVYGLACEKTCRNDDNT